MVVIWKDIPGFEGHYQASTDGQIRSMDREEKFGNATRTRKGRIMKLSPDKRGYPKVILCKDGKIKIFKVHRLIASVFLEDSDLQINHENGDKECNEIWNLFYVTNRENMNHAFETGLKKGRFLSLSEIDKIREMNETGNYTNTKLAEIFRVSRTTVKRVIDSEGSFASGETDRNIEPPGSVTFPGWEKYA